MKNINWILKQWWFWVAIAIITTLVIVKKNKDKKKLLSTKDWLESRKKAMISDLKQFLASDEDNKLEVWYFTPGTVEQVANFENMVFTEEQENTNANYVSIENPEDVDNLTPIELAAFATAYLDLDQPGYKWVRNILADTAVRGSTFEQELARSLNFHAKQIGLWAHL
jgi:hypothetical protein